MFQTFLVQPIYNAFVALVGIMPHGDAGLAIVTLTVIMRLVLYPVFTASIRTQMGMAAMQGELDTLKEKFKDDKEAAAKGQLALFKKYKVNPLAGFGALFIQLAVIIALYFALFREGFPVINPNLLYSFVHVPAIVSTSFFGIVDLLTPRHVLLAAIVGLTQYLAIRLTLARTPAPAAAAPEKLAAHRMQQGMMLYFMPLLMAVTSYYFAAAVGLYFVAGNIFSLGQEWHIRRQQLQK
ncbi:membrane protein insertase YidC [Candidatus Kaiserbacteria bacterium]|nr:membrane protein insertase YidC [Candidatus Kaiserbacteria bacterium]